MLGTTAQETDDWPVPAGMRTWSWVDYEHYLFEHLSAFSSDLAAQVQHLYYKVGSPELQFTTLVTDMRETCPVNAVAQLLSFFWKEPVYRYVANFTQSRGTPISEDAPLTDSNVITYRDGEIVGSFRYSYHSIDMYHFFNKNGAGSSSSSREARQFSELLRNSVFEFARTGRISNWQLFPQSAVISSQLTHVKTYQTDQCSLWQTTEMFPKYAWMN